MKIQKILVFAAFLFFVSISAQQTKAKLNGKEVHNVSFTLVTKQNLEQTLKNKEAAFIINAIHNGFDTKSFEEKYGVRIKVENCVVMPTISEKENNRILANYFTEKFGEIWKKEIPVLPMSL